MSTDVTPVSDNASSDSGKKTIFGHPILSADYRDDIDGLRSIAVLGVVLYHARMSRLTGGFSGVDIFFVISGYLIGGHVYGQLQRGQFSFRQFYRNRAKRILPALYAVLAAVFVTGLLLLSPSELKDLASATFATTASASNIWFCKTTGYFSASAELNPLLMTWSLGVEEQFYFVIPVLLAVLFRVGRRLILPLLAIIACASFVLTIYQLGNNPASAFYLPFSRSWELCGGVLFAIIEANGHLPSRSSSDWASNCFGWASMTFPGAAALPSVLGAALILYSRGSFVNRRVLSLPPLMFVGRVSYSFYLIHWPVLAFLRVIKGDTLPQLTGLVSVFISFLLAVASYFLIETPFRSSKLAAWPLLARYGAVSLSILLISGIIFWNGGLRSRFPEVAELDSHAASSHEDPCLVSDGKDSPNLSDGCTAASESGPHLAVWGDSHAAAIARSLANVAAPSGYSVEEYAKAVCPPLLGVGRYYRDLPLRLAECVRFNRAVLGRILANPRIHVVVLYAYWDAPFDPRSDTGKLAAEKPVATPTQAASESLLQQGLRSTLSSLTAAGKRVIVLGDTPTFNVDPLWRMRTTRIPVRRNLTELLNGRGQPINPGLEKPYDDTETQNAAARVLQTTASSFSGVTFWDMRAGLCPSVDWCRYRQGETPLYYDTNHVSATGGLDALRGLPIPAP